MLINNFAYYLKVFNHSAGGLRRFEQPVHSHHTDGPERPECLQDHSGPHHSIHVGEPSDDFLFVEQHFI